MGRHYRTMGKNRMLLVMGRLRPRTPLDTQLPGLGSIPPTFYLWENSGILLPFEIPRDCTSKFNGSRIEARVKQGVINECRLFRAERFQLVLSKESCGKGGRSPAMTHTVNPNTHFALVNIKMCTYFFFPLQLASWRVSG